MKRRVILVSQDATIAEAVRSAFPDAQIEAYPIARYLHQIHRGHAPEALVIDLAADGALTQGMRFVRRPPVWARGTRTIVISRVPSPSAVPADVRDLVRLVFRGDGRLQTVVAALSVHARVGPPGSVPLSLHA